MSKSFYSLLGSLFLIIATVIAIIGFYYIFYNAYAILYGISVPLFLQVIFYLILLPWLLKKKKEI